MALCSLATRKAIGLGKSVGLGLRGLQTVTLPDLPYDYNALEPVISGEIMQLHHQKHHQAYVTNYNKALEQLDQALNKVDTSTVVKLQSAIKFNGGGHVNHSIFWKNLAPVREGGGEPPHSSLGWAIDTHFGSLEALIQKMNAEGAAVQGSGWVWLGVDTEFKKLVVETTANQGSIDSLNDYNSSRAWGSIEHRLKKSVPNNGKIYPSLTNSFKVGISSPSGPELITPMTGMRTDSLGGMPGTDPLVTKASSLVPLLGIDVWEHAYYLQYKNVKPDYLKNIWKVMNWKYASEVYEKECS